MFQLFSYPLTVFKDSNTPSPFIEHFPNDDGCAAKNALPDHIYMDCMGFGMGCSCLQVLDLIGYTGHVTTYALHHYSLLYSRSHSKHVTLMRHDTCMTNSLLYAR